MKNKQLCNYSLPRGQKTTAMSRISRQMALSPLLNLIDHFTFILTSIY